MASGWGAGCATGLAIVLGGDLYDRLGVCTAPHCDRVYVDTSRNGTRRFCSTACQNRVKAAAFRERKVPSAGYGRGQKIPCLPPDLAVNLNRPPFARKKGTSHVLARPSFPGAAPPGFPAAAGGPAHRAGAMAFSIVGVSFAVLNAGGTPAPTCPYVVAAQLAPCLVFCSAGAG